MLLCNRTNKRKCSMKTITFFVFSMFILVACGDNPRSGNRVPRSQLKKDSLDKAVTDSMTRVMTVSDSMKFVFDDLREEYQKFLKENKEFDLLKHTKNSFVYKDSLGQQVSIEVFPISTRHASIYLPSNGAYSISHEGERFIVRSYKWNLSQDRDSLVVNTPEELERALLPFHVHMRHATLSVLKLKMAHKKKLDDMVQAAI